MKNERIPINCHRVELDLEFVSGHDNDKFIIKINELSKAEYDAHIASYANIFKKNTICT